jgi:hypothetical protein
MMGAALVLWTAAASAQDKPNFNGKWTLDAEKTAAANPGGGGGGGGGRGGGGRGGMGGGPVTITVDATSLTRETETQNGPVKQVYKLDGSETDVQMGPMTAKAKAKWDGATIVIETTSQTQDGGTRTTKAVYALEGEYLVIANTQPPRGGGEPVTRKQYYKKG